MTEQAVHEELRLLGVTDRHPGLSDLALCLARALEEAEAPTAIAAVAAQLRAVMKDLCNLATPAEEGDVLDDLAARRAARRA
ncbi:hypothetical protein ACFCW4_02605 [Streptomyces virginiae]|uniref:hypothetical protein n=1 Tax=Streptomyces virginiae TaxID=1961 RepID=UPI0035DFBA92